MLLLFSHLLENKLLKLFSLRNNCVLIMKTFRLAASRASLLPKYIEDETGIRPYVGQLNKPYLIDNDESGNVIIDELPLDYSILEEIDYRYPAEDAYFGYMTRGCTNCCSFCAVPKLEPNYCGYISIKENSKRVSYVLEQSEICFDG